MNEIRCSIELREDQSRQSPGRLVGTLLEYEKRAVDRPEIFSRDSLQWDESGIVLNLSHDRKQPVARFNPEVRENKVMIDMPLPDTQRGRDAATMIRNKTLLGLSVEFRALQDNFSNGVREVRKAMLMGAALVDSASYGNSVEIREQSKYRRRRMWL